MEEKSKKSEDKDNSSDNGREKMKVWLQENLRMIVSIVIVVLIAGGIYSYSKRTQPSATKQSAQTEESSEGKISVIGQENAAEEQPSGEARPVDAEQAKPSQESAVDTQASQETESSFVETAAKGDSTTKLARRALANYLEKNPDSSLTAEHKIYIEDMLRREVPDGRIAVGAKREFTKDMIANAIEKSKNLNEKQLKNLQKYAQRVPGL